MGWGSRCVAIALATALGCGLQVAGTGPTEGAPLDDAGAPRDATRTAADVGTLTTAADAAWPTAPTPCSCGLTVPAGFTEIAYEDGRAAACPSDMTAFDVVTSPTAGAGACGCAPCAVTATPSCADGTFSSDYDQNASNNPTCDQHAVSHPCNNGLCATLSGSYGEHGRAVPPAPSGTGACTSRGVVNAAAAQSLPARACAESATRCACDATLGASFHACLRAPGDVACPAQAPNKHLVGSSASVQCTDCECALSATCGGSITFYSDPNCATALFTITEKACTIEGTGNYGSYKWQGTTATQCTLGTSAASAALADPSTICCP